MQFSTTFKQFLTDHGITQTKLAEESGIHRTQITQYCSNQRRPSLDSIITISDTLERLTKIRSMKISVIFIRALREDIKKGGMSC